MAKKKRFTIKNRGQWGRVLVDGVWVDGYSVYDTDKGGFYDRFQKFPKEEAQQKAAELNATYVERELTIQQRKDAEAARLAALTPLEREIEQAEANAKVAAYTLKHDEQNLVDDVEAFAENYEFYAKKIRERLVRYQESKNTGYYHVTTSPMQLVTDVAQIQRNVHANVSMEPLLRSIGRLFEQQADLVEARNFRDSLLSQREEPQDAWEAECLATDETQEDVSEEVV